MYKWDTNWSHGLSPSTLYIFPKSWKAPTSPQNSLFVLYYDFSYLSSVFMTGDMTLSLFGEGLVNQRILQFCVDVILPDVYYIFVKQVLHLLAIAHRLLCTYTIIGSISYADRWFTFYCKCWRQVLDVSTYPFDLYTITDKTISMS